VIPLALDLFQFVLVTAGAIVAIFIRPAPEEREDR
jgi:hypothetical protein